MCAIFLLIDPLNLTHRTFKHEPNILKPEVWLQYRESNVTRHTTYSQMGWCFWKWCPRESSTPNAERSPCPLTLSEIFPPPNPVEIRRDEYSTRGKYLTEVVNEATGKAPSRRKQKARFHSLQSEPSRVRTQNNTCSKGRHILGTWSKRRGQTINK